MAGNNPRQPTTRRGACDRCRGQKLRCSREGQNGTVDSTQCARCAKAGAVCSFSNPITPARQTTATVKSSAKRKEGKASGQKASWEATSTRDSDVTLQTDLFERSLRNDPFKTMASECRGEDDGSSSSRRLASTFDTSESPGALEAYLTSDNSSFSMDFYNPLGTSNMISAEKNDYLNAQYPFDFQSFVQDPHQDPLQAHNIGTSHLAGFAARAANDDASGDEGRSPTTLFSNTKPRGATAITPPHFNLTDSPGHTCTAEQGAHCQLRSGDAMDCDVTDDLWPEPPRSKVRSGTNPSSLFSPLGPLQDTRHRRLQELSDLGITFYGQILETISPAPSVNNPSALAGKVVSGSTKFLHLLTTLYSTSPSPTPSSTINGTWDNRKSSSSIEDDVFSQVSSSSSSSDLNITTPTPAGCGTSTGDRSPLFPMEPPSKYTHARSAPEKYRRRKRTLSSSQPSHTTGRPEANGHVEVAEAAGAEGNQPADIPEVFALLTCYIRLLHLHDLLYTRIAEVLIPHSQEQSSSVPASHRPGSSSSTQGHPSGNSSAPSLASQIASSASDDGVVDGLSNTQNDQRNWVPLFPGLCLDGVCLDKFAKFQIKFLLQITAHTLGEIEGELGLPEGYRVSRRRRGSGAEVSIDGTEARKQQRWKGIFESSCVSQGFIEMTMKERGLAIERPATGTGTGIGVGDRLMSIRRHLMQLRKLLKGTINP
ncbi:MAG: hypothetical protein LQ343_006257 [Gyalolechia ehrenbergii]|nr:MAG: hypothetical protein LQ343_006257 [Gyalolechia ehrenbergii]